MIAGTAGATIGNPPSWLVRAFGIIDPTIPNDGTVTVEETRLETPHAFAAVPASHTWIMNHPRTRALTLRFLACGRFGEAEP